MNGKSNKSKYSIAGKITSVVLSAAMVGTTFLGLTGTSISANAATPTTTSAITDYGLADTSQHGVILHCWNWSYNNIKKYMKDIAAAGYTSIQTSPVTQPKDYYWEGVAYGNVGIPDGTGGYEGNWWKSYQPVTMSICDNGHTWYGTKAEFKAMCDEAEKYGIKVIVDIVANHMGNIKGYIIGDSSKTYEENAKKVMSDISKQIGEFWNPDMLTDPSYWHISTSWTHTSDGRFDVTQGNMGMPDLNTGDSKVQQMVLNLLKECIDCGADGFRFDAAKHIETPADNPKFASNFWDVVLDGARDYYKKVNGYDGIYFYGEVLNRLDDTKAEAYYRSKMSVTDNSKSDNIRNSVKYDSASGAAQGGYSGYIGGDGTKAVLWAESHDTYMGGGSSYDVNDSDIKKTWAMVASRKDSTALFFARPYYSKYILKNDTSGYESRQTYSEILAQTDQTQLGDVGTLTWADKEVVEVNRFHNFFVGQSESLGSSGQCAYNVRGKKGIVIAKMDGAGAVSISGTGMADGTYTDQVSGNKFTVSGGKLTGTVGSKDGIAVVYNPTKHYADPNPEEPAVIKISAETSDGSAAFTGDSVSVTMTTENASSATYTTTEGQSGSFKGSKTITVGSSLSVGESVTIKITATAADGTKKEKSFIFTKKTKRTGYPTLSSGGVVFDNAEYGWSKVYAYVYNDAQGQNAAWPGIAMKEVDGDFYTYELPSKFTGTVNVIFNNGSGTQIPGANQPGMKMSVTDKKLFVNDALTDLPTGTVSDFKVSLSGSPTSVNVGDTVLLKASVTGGNGSVTYKFTSSDGTVIQPYGSSASCKWIPTKAGTYTITVNAKDSLSNATAKTKITVNEKAIPLANNSKISSSTIYNGESVTITGAATGGTKSYKYAFYVKPSSSSSWTTIQSYSTNAKKTWKPDKAGKYDIRVTVSDGKTTVSKTFTLNVSAPLANTSKISSSTIYRGNSVTITGAATGGTKSYKYAFYVKPSSSSKWTTIQSYSTNSKKTWKPDKTGKYNILVKVSDGKKTVSKTFTLNVLAPLANTSKISKSTIYKGESITITGAATGGTKSYKYEMYVKSSSAKNWTKIKSYSTTATKTWKPDKTGKYYIRVNVNDGKKTVSKTLTLNILSPLANKSTVSKTNVKKGSTITLKAAATGGKSPYKYTFTYRNANSKTWKTLKSNTSSSTYNVKMNKAGKYYFNIYVKDSAGKTVRKTFTVTVK